jgi:hypothetical protein
MPWFYVDDGFSDSKPVLNLPERYRLAACGLWVLAGSWSAKEETDGEVPDEVLGQFGHGNTINALTRHLSSGPAPLWKSTDDGIQFRGWAKWQRTRAELMAKRASDAARQKRHRGRNAPPEAADLLTANGRETDGKPTANGRETDGKPTANGRENYTETGSTSVNAALSQCDPARAGADPTRPLTVVTYEAALRNEPRARAAVPELFDAQSATPAAELVRAVIPSEHPPAVQTALRLRASELLHNGTPADDVTAALRLWLTKKHLGPNSLASLVSEVIKTRADPTVNGAATTKALGYRQLGAELIAEIHGDQP